VQGKRIIRLSGKWPLFLGFWWLEGLIRRGGGRRSPLLIWRELQVIRHSGLFDGQWYEEQYPDLAGRFADPLWHYMLWGVTEGRDPHPLFDSDWYLEQNPDVAARGVNPLAHYLSQGAMEGRDPHPLFAGGWYLTQYPDVAAAGWNPLVHYVRWGGAEGRDPHPLFDVGYFLQHAREEQP
jgi:hypothetical protein